MRVVVLRSGKVVEGSFNRETSQYGSDFGCFFGGVSPFDGVFPDFVFVWADSLCVYPFLKSMQGASVFFFKSFFDFFEEGQFFE